MLIYSFRFREPITSRNSVNPNDSLFTCLFRPSCYLWQLRERVRRTILFTGYPSGTQLASTRLPAVSYQKRVFFFGHAINFILTKMAGYANNCACCVFMDLYHVLVHKVNKHKRTFVNIQPCWLPLGQWPIYIYYRGKTTDWAFCGPDHTWGGSWHDKSPLCHAVQFNQFENIRYKTSTMNKANFSTRPVVSDSHPPPPPKKTIIT